MQRMWRLREKARMLITGHWTAGYWVKSLSQCRSWSPGDDSGSKVDSLRDWLVETGHLDEEKMKLVGDYCMCPEGAIYLSCALDPKATDKDVARLIEETERKLPPLTQEQKDETGYLLWTGIADFNDQTEIPEDKIIRILFT